MNDSLFAPPPAGAIVLLGGDDVSEWVLRKDGRPCDWTVEEGVMTVRPGSGDIQTKRRFTDFELHLQFRLPNMPDKTGQARGNSGLYLHGLYEIQILDTWENETYPMGVCGALYNQAAPLLNASTPPETWQVYQVRFRAPKFDADGKRITDGSVTIDQNGKRIHDGTPITEPTGGHLSHSPSEPGPILLQDHGDQVSFRNIWIREL